MAVVPAAPASAATNSVCALTSDRQAVLRYDGTSWTQIGGPAFTLYGGPYGLFATNRDRTGIDHYLGTPFSWQSIGDGGATWAVTGDALYGLSPDRGSVWKWTGSPWWWVQVGGPADNLWGGGGGLYATIPGGNGISKYLSSPFNWQFLGSIDNPPRPARSYAVSSTTLYGLSQSGGLSKWDLGGFWVRSAILPPLVHIFGGGANSVGVDSSNTMHSFDFQTLNPPIAGPGLPFVSGSVVTATSGGATYATSAAGDSVWRHVGGVEWVNIGNMRVTQLVPCP
ncbi:hypothetical protein J5X84_36805 [Streptosporangiaceae bacterium NEAU-GS5]|nr:hypothetical protein [Streptosporangiaceae bacterium NEAU-GS5]